MGIPTARQWLDDEFTALVTEHHVPGAAIAVLADGEVIEHAAGTVNASTGVEVTVDSVFQIGSITKIWGATLAMQLVDEGELDLDAPVRRYLPGLRLADESAAASLTTRHLLTHTGGFEGDRFDVTTGDDTAVERFVDDLLPQGRQVFAPGEQFSYNNAAFIVLGRLVEVLRGLPWATALRRHLIEPLGLTHAATNPDEALRYRTAIGHINPDQSPPDEWVPAERWGLPWSTAPAGAMLSMSAGELLSLARLHLDDGTVGDQRLLSASLVADMRVPHIDVPQRRSWISRQGLGWDLPDWPGIEVFGHDGNTIGQSAFLRVFPDHGVAIAMLTNGGRTQRLYDDVFGRLVPMLTSVEAAESYTLPTTAIPITDPDRYIGTYGNAVAGLDIEADDGAFSVTVHARGETGANQSEPRRHPLVHIGDGMFTVLDDGYPASALRLMGDEGGRAQFLHNHRLNPRE